MVKVAENADSAWKVLTSASELETKGDIDGLFGRMPSSMQRLVRRVMDAPNYDFGAMELLDALEIEWRKTGE